MGLLARYSPNQKLDKKMIEKLEKYFAYYWSHDRNFAVRTEQGERFISELPKNVRQQLYTQFLFKDFMYLFRNYFAFDEMKNGKHINSFAQQSKKELSFIVAFLQKLEPRMYNPQDIILSELDDVEELIFVVAGEYGVGYEFNKIKCYGKKIGRKTVIGDYYVLFTKKSEFIFTCFKEIHGFIIRK